MKNLVNGIALEEEVSRGGMPVVFIHGFPFSRRMWEPQRQEFSKNYRVISYDVRGHGQSEVGDGQYTVELFVDDLMAVMDHLEIRDAVLCGLSMGGYIALRAVERHPDRFKGLVLCDTKSEADSNETKIKRAEAMRAVKKNGVEVFAKEFVKIVLTEKTLTTRQPLVESVLDLIRENSPLGISGTLLALAGRTDTTAALAKMSLPVLILVGEEDKLTPPAVSEKMAREIPDAKMHIIPEAAHLANLENPAMFNQRLGVFLKQLTHSC